MPLAVHAEGDNILLPTLIIFSIALVAWYVFYLVRKTIQKRHRTPIPECDVLLIIDLKNRTLCDADENQLAPLQHVSLQKQFQLASSSPAYAVVWPTGKKVIARGNPFAGGVSSVVEALQQNGIALH